MNTRNPMELSLKSAVLRFAWSFILVAILPALPACADTTETSTPPVEIGGAATENARASGCIISNWSDWSPCQQSCKPTEDSISYKYRTRYIILPPSAEETCPESEPEEGEFEIEKLRGLGNSTFSTGLADYKLCEDIQSCSDEDVVSEWSEWSGCTQEVINLRGDSARLESRRKYFYSISTANMKYMQKQLPGKGHKFAQYRICRGDSSGDKTEAGATNDGDATDGGAADGDKAEVTAATPGVSAVAQSEERTAILRETDNHTAIEISNEIELGTTCDSLGEWTDCDAPCLQDDGTIPMRYRARFSKKTGEYCGKLESEKCPLTLRKCPDSKIDCSFAKAIYDDGTQDLDCQKRCEEAQEACIKTEKNPSLQYQCINAHRIFKSTVKFFERCTLSYKGNFNSCFLSWSKRHPSENSWKHSEVSGDCSCAEENAVPCTSEEVYYHAATTQQINEYCKLAEKPTAGKTPAFLATSHFGRINCPIHTGKPTYGTFMSKYEVSRYCQFGTVGLVAEDVLKRYHGDAFRYSCRAGAPSADDPLVVKRCDALCAKIEQFCATEDQSFSKCVNNYIGLTEESDATFFGASCIYEKTPNIGKGLTFCKLKEQPCKFAEWSEWSECTASCLRNKFEYPQRSRHRKLIQGAINGAIPCGQTYDEGGTLHQQLCSWLPSCDASESSNADNFVSSGEDENEVNKSPVEVATLQKLGKSFASHEASSDENVAKEDSCEIVYSGDFPTQEKSYDRESNSCSCPQSRRVCNIEDARKSMADWIKHMKSICDSNPHNVIYAEDFGIFSCGSLDFLPYKKPPDAFSPQKGCETQKYYNFCSIKKEDMHGNAEGNFYLALSIISGCLSAIVLTFLLIQYNEDLQILLALKTAASDVDSEVHEKYD